MRGPNKIAIFLDANINLRLFKEQVVRTRLNYLFKALNIEARVVPLHLVQEIYRTSDEELLNYVKELSANFNKVFILTYDKGFPTDGNIIVIKIPPTKRRSDEFVTYIVKEIIKHLKHSTS